MKGKFEEILDKIDTFSNSEIGTTTDAAGTATTGTVMGKLNKLITNGEAQNKRYEAGTDNTISFVVGKFQPSIGTGMRPSSSHWFGKPMNSYWVPEYSGFVTVTASGTVTAARYNSSNDTSAYAVLYPIAVTLNNPNQTLPNCLQLAKGTSVTVDRDIFSGQGISSATTASAETSSSSTATVSFDLSWVTYVESGKPFYLLADLICGSYAITGTNLYLKSLSISYSVADA